jgi:F-type H+-transporting ATPase subunit delta
LFRPAVSRLPCREAWNDRGARITRLAKRSAQVRPESFRRGRKARKMRMASRRSVAAVVLHLRSRYVSKAAIFQGGYRAYPFKIEVPLEFQGLGSLGAADGGDGFSLASLTAIKSASVAAEDLSVSGVSGRYATALFELARDERAIDAVLVDLDNFNDLLDDSADLRRLVRSPVFSADMQVKALTVVLDKAGITGISANFLKVLTANRRLFAVADVIRAFRVLVAKFKGEANADVTVAEALSEKNLDALKAALKSVTGKDVNLHVKVDPAIIGGLVVKLGSRMVDSSLRTKLNSIKHAMKEAG